MVEPADLKTHLYAELIDAIDRSDEDILFDAIASAEGEAAGYLSRYDADAILAKLGDDRHPALLMYLKDMAVWHFITLANANTDLEFRRTRYEDALTWLKGIQKGTLVIKGWPPAPTEGADLYFHVSSAPKRPTRW